MLLEDSLVFLGGAGGYLEVPFKDHFLDELLDDNIPQLKLLGRIIQIYKNERSDTVFIGTPKGLYYSIRGEVLGSNNTELSSKSITYIAGGDNNTYWIGTSSNGIYQIKNDSILTHINETNGLISNIINHITYYDKELLVSTKRGLAIINLTNNEIKTVNEFNFLPSNEVVICKIINDQYWIGTFDGLTILSRDDIGGLTSERSKISLKNFFVNGVNLEYYSGMVLDHTDNNIQFNIRNISFKSGKDKSIKYRIPLIDTSWINTSDPNIRLPALQPGKYHIETLGINAIGQTSAPFNIYFEIDNPWWKKLWAQLLVLLIVIAVGNVILLYRGRRIRREEAVKRDYLMQINKIKDQALQLQMNPHFIFNSLNAIQGFIGTDNEEMAMNYLARFARLIRLIFEHSKGNTITLEEELEFINLYLDLEKLRFKEKVNVSISLDEEIQDAKDMMRVPPLLIQPIIENSFKHGLFHKKGNGNLSIGYSFQDNLLQVTIQDDGIGREESRKIANKNTEKHNSSGIKTTRERIDILNFGKEQKRNSMKIEDLYDEAGKPCGTRTILKLAVT